MPTVYHFTRINDADLMKFFQEVELDEYQECTNFTLMDRIGFTLHEEDDPPILNALGGSTYLIQRAHYEVSDIGLTLTYMRGQRGTISGPNINWSSEEPFIDGLGLTGPRDKSDPIAVEIAKKISELISLAPPVDFRDQGEAGLLQASVILNRVSSAAAQITEFTAQRQAELDKLRDQLVVEFDGKVEKEKERLAASFQDQKNALQRAKVALDERADALDDRENTHVRREIQTKLANLTDDLLSKDLLEKSKSANFTLLNIAMIVGGMLMGAALLTGNSISDGTSQDRLLFLEITRVALGLGAAAAFWFAIHQARARYAQVSSWEHQLHRFRLDAERAAFLVEGDLEARKTGEGGLPEVMLERFSRSLFAYESENDQTDQVGHTLAHLLNRPAGLEVGPDGIKVSVDKGALRRASKELEKD